MVRQVRMDFVPASLLKDQKKSFFFLRCLRRLKSYQAKFDYPLGGGERELVQSQAGRVFSCYTSMRLWDYCCSLSVY